MDEVAAVNQSIDMPEQEEEIPHEPIISAFTQNVSQEREVIDTTHMVENELEEASDDVQIQGTDAVENADYQLPSYNLLQLPPQHDQSGEYSVIQANAKNLSRHYKVLA